MIDLLQRVTNLAFQPLEWLLCRLGCHDWRYMNGVCCSCGYYDPLWQQNVEIHVEQALTGEELLREHLKQASKRRRGE